MFFPALTVMSALSGLVLWGSSTCPSPREVDARLPRAFAADVQVELTAAHELVLRDEQGRVLATRTLASAATCEVLADEAASAITAWVLGPARKPMYVGYIEPRPVNERRRVELWAGGGFAANTERRVQVAGFSGLAELHLAPESSGALLSAALSVDGPLRLTSASHSWVSGQGWRIALGLGGGARARMGTFVLDAFVLLPLSMLVPTAVDVAPLGPGLQPAVLFGVQAGLRLAAWLGRFAPYVRIAVDATLVSTGQLLALPVALNLGVGIAWSGA